MNGAACRLVIRGDRCLGGQFLDVKQDMGLVRALMIQRRNVGKLLEMLQDRKATYCRGWLGRVRKFF